MTESRASAETTKRLFRPYRVVSKQAESQVITSFVLEPLDGQPISPYLPGQYLVFKFNIDGQSLLRNYSVSGDPDKLNQLRISVKHEKSPAGLSVPDGISSSYLHTKIEVGDTLQAAGPLGDFYLDESTERPVVLLSGGVGLTPMLSMLHRLTNYSRRQVHFMHACENGDVHAFAQEVLELAAKRSDIHALFWYRLPLASDQDKEWSFVDGLLTREQLQQHLPLDDYDFYLCGPSGFMQANYALLRSLGVASHRIYYEFFGPATILEETLVETAASDLVTPTLPESVEVIVLESTEGGHQITFLPDNRHITWQEDYESLLVAAEEAGLSPDFNCRSGLCNTCMCTLVSGEVDYIEEPLDDVPEGKVLLCCSKPKGPVVVDLGDS